MSERGNDIEGLSSWLADQRVKVERFIYSQGVDHGPIPNGPEWFLPRGVSVWTVPSTLRPGPVGWWVVSTDVSTDWVSGFDATDVRSAVASLARHWTALAGSTIGVGDLSAQIKTQADFLRNCAEDDRLW